MTIWLWYLLSLPRYLPTYLPACTEAARTTTSRGFDTRCISQPHLCARRWPTHSRFLSDRIRQASSHGTRPKPSLARNNHDPFIHDSKHHHFPRAHLAQQRREKAPGRTGESVSFFPVASAVNLLRSPNNTIFPRPRVFFSSAFSFTSSL